MEHKPSIVPTREPSSTDGRRRELPAVAVVLLIAIAVRAVYLLQYKAHIPYFYNVTLDSAYYDGWAQRVAEGKGYGLMPFYMAPLYPYVLALIYKIFGHSLPLIYLLQAILGVVNTGLVYALGRRLFSHTVGLVAMCLVTLYAPLIYLESKLLTEILAITLSLLGVIMLMRTVERPTVFRYLTTGLVFGVGAVCRPAALLMVVLFLLWHRRADREAKSRQSMRVLVPFLIGVVLPIIPVTARNCLVGNEFALLSTNAGIVFAQGNSEAASGISSPLPGFSASILTQQQEEMAKASEVLGYQVTASESSSFWFKVGLRFILHKPGAFGLLLIKKLIWSLHNRESPCSYNLYYERMLVPVLRYLPLPFAVLFGFSVFGFMRALRGRMSHGITLLGLYIVSIFLSLIVFSVSSRYRTPMAPALAIFAGFGLVQVSDMVRARHLQAVGLAVGLMAASFLPSLMRFPMGPVTPEAPSNMGVSYLDMGRVSEAVVELRRSLSIDPNYPYAHNNLGNALVRQDKLDEAVSEYEKALKIHPAYPEAHFNLAEALVRQSKLDEAIEHYNECISLVPDRAQSHGSLGVALFKAGRVDEAIEAFRTALDLDPNAPDAARNLEVALAARQRTGQGRAASGPDAKEAAAIEHYNKANAALRERNPDAAIKEYREAIRVKPDFARAYNNLAVTLFLSGDYQGAWKVVHDSRKYGVKMHPDFLKGLSEKMTEPEQ